jgi:leukotriene-A4 hydrolase
VFGKPLEVTLKDGLAMGTKVTVRISYTTSPNASACQWLPPEQTAGKKYPYLFTQSQAIHARSIIPCQDAPAVKVTYRAKVSAPNWATVLMSALREADEEKMDGAGRRTFVWQQPVPIPSYLIAMAVGDLESREISHRSDA